MFVSVLIQSFPLYFIQWKSLNISQQFHLLSFCSMYTKIITPKTVNMVANRTSSGFRAKYHNEINDRWEMLIHCSHGFSLSANTVCSNKNITLCFVLFWKNLNSLGFFLKLRLKPMKSEYTIASILKQSKEARKSCRMGSWFFSAESSSQRCRLVFFFTVSNSPKSLVYHIHVRYITLLFFRNTGIFYQRQACTPLRYLIWNI